MKKKLIVLAALVTIAATSAMANTEIDLNYYITPIISRSKGNLATYTVPSFVGLEGNFNWFFGSNAGIFDVGLNMDTGIHAITGKVKWDWKNSDGSTDSYESVEPYGGVGVFLSLGPVFRFTFTNIFSLSLIPGLQAEFYVAGYKSDISRGYNGGLIDFSVAASINAAAKLWFVNVTGYHMGLNLGVDVDFPFTGALVELGKVTPTLISGNATRYGSGMDLRIFAGIAFQFGDRAYDRQFNE